MATAPAFRLLTSLDITGSMSSEIEGVKQAVAGLVDLTRNLELPISYAVSTFTEGGKHCCTSLAEFAEPEAALEYVQGIKLCQPPEEPHLSMNGDDVAENTKAALVRLTDLDPDVPTIAFLITDAPPHLQSHRPQTDTYRAEVAWLQARGLAREVAGDVFKVVETVVKEHFGPSLLLNCVLYSCRQEELQVYGQLAQAMGGMLMHPTSRQSEVLAQGLLSVVRALLARLLPAGALGAEGAPTSLEGFELYDTSRLEPRASEEEPARGTVARGDGEALFAIAMERMEAVVGSKWSKRALGMTAPALQLEFVWRIARFVAAQQQAAAADAGTGAADAAAPFASRDAELAGLMELRQRIVEQLPEQSRGHFSIEAEDISAWAAEAARAAANRGVGAAGAAASCISLATVGDELAEEADWEDWLATVMRLLQGFPLHLQLPLDKFGYPDFMDAWSAVVQKLGVDRINSAEFMALVGPHAAAKGPTDGSRHNAFLVVVQPGDALAALVFKAASGTQVLNYVSGVLMGARGFLPNLHAGTAASCLVGLLSSGEQLTEFRWEQALAIAHTLRCMHRPAARAIAQQLAAGKANPADPAPKFVAALLSLGARLPAGALGDKAPGAASPAAPASREQLHAAARLVLEEWMAALVQRHYGKRGPQSDADYLASLQQYLPLELLLPECGGGAVDPLCALHPLEEQELPLGRVNPGWQAAAVRRLRGEEEGVPAHPMLARFEHCAAALLALLLGAEASAAPAPEEGRALLAACWPEWEAAFITALLLRQRTARYSVTAAEAAAGSCDAAGEGAGVVWERVEVATPVELALGRAREALAAELAGFKKARTEAALEQLLATTVEALRAAASAGADAEAASAALKELYVPLGPARTAGAVGGAAGAAAGTAAGEAGEGAAARPTSAPLGPVATLLNQTVCLDRASVPLILERLLPAQQAEQHGQPEGKQAPAAQAAPAQQQLPQALLRCLVAGSWTTVPPQALRNCQLVRQLALSTPGCEDLLELITAREVCTRATGHNRHGHSAKLNYPGPAGWTKEYAEARLAAVPRLAPYLEMMRRFTEMAEWARGVGARQGAKCQMAVAALLTTFEDANWLPVALMRVEALVGESMPGAAAAGGADE